MLVNMCRSIKTLRGEEVIEDEEVRAAALQFVRKVSGYRKPSRANEDVFEGAVDEIAASTRKMLDSLVMAGAARGT
jgi:hypothetical protein